MDIREDWSFDAALRTVGVARQSRHRQEVERYSLNWLGLEMSVLKALRLSMPFENPNYCLIFHPSMLWASSQ